MNLGTSKTRGPREIPASSPVRRFNSVSPLSVRALAHTYIMDSKAGEERLEMPSSKRKVETLAFEEAFEEDHSTDSSSRSTFFDVYGPDVPSVFLSLFLSLPDICFVTVYDVYVNIIGTLLHYHVTSV